MKLERQIAKDWEAAMMSDHRHRKRALSMLRARILTVHIEQNRRALNDEEIYQIIKDMIIERKETIRSVAGQGRITFISKEAFEIMAIDPYLPESMI